MNQNFSICDIKIDEIIYLKHRTFCKKFHNENRRKNNNNTITENEIDTTPQQPKINKINNKHTIVSKYENHANVAIGPKNVGKKFYKLKVLGKIGNQRPIHIIARSLNQHPSYKTSIEFKSIDNYNGSVVIFDDMLGARNCSQIDESFTRGRHENLDVYYISQSCFALPRQSIRNNSDRIILFKQTLRGVQSMYYIIGAHVMKYDECK